MPYRQLYLARACRWRQMADAAVNDATRSALLQLAESYERLAASTREPSHELPAEPAKGVVPSGPRVILEKEPEIG